MKKTTQLERVFHAMKTEGRWLALHEIKDAIFARYDHLDSECAISARLREIGTAKATARHPEMAGYAVAKDRMVGRSTFLYRLVNVATLPHPVSLPPGFGKGVSALFDVGKPARLRR